LGPERRSFSLVEFGETDSGSNDMPKFFFHVRDADGDLSCDAEGQELPDLAAARTEAIRANREMLGERLLHGGSLNHRQMEITDESGRLLAVIHAEDVLFQDGQLNSFSDDVTKSAPSIPPVSSGAKPPVR
jgi:hypothetical protein